MQDLLLPMAGSEASGAAASSARTRRGGGSKKAIRRFGLPLTEEVRLTPTLTLVFV